MTFSHWVSKNKDKLKNIPTNMLNDWIEGKRLPDWKVRNNILWTNHCAFEIKDSDGFIFNKNKAGANTKYNINNKMVYYRSDTWEKIMKRKIKSTKGKCEICGSTDDLTVHHLIYNENWGGKEKDSELLTCCCRCHMIQHKDKPECVKVLRELESPIRELIINVKKDASVSVYVFTDCEDGLIKAYMRNLYAKLKITKYINNCKLYKTRLEGEPNKQNDRWFAISVLKNGAVEVHQCNSKENAQKYKKQGLASFTVMKPDKTINSNKLSQIYHPKKK